MQVSDWTAAQATQFVDGWLDRLLRIQTTLNTIAARKCQCNELEPRSVVSCLYSLEFLQNADETVRGFCEGEVLSCGVRHVSISELILSKIWQQK